MEASARRSTITPAQGPARASIAARAGGGMPPLSQNGYDDRCVSLVSIACAAHNGSETRSCSRREGSVYNYDLIRMKRTHPIFAATFPRATESMTENGYDSGAFAYLAKATDC